MGTLGHRTIKSLESPLKIESGIPLPEKFKSRISNFPIKDMKIGDSVLISKDLYSNVQSAANSLRALATRHGVLLHISEVDDGYRAWRVK